MNKALWSVSGSVVYKRTERDEELGNEWVGWVDGMYQDGAQSPP